MENSTGAPMNFSGGEVNWDYQLRIFEGFQVFYICISAFIFLSVVVYGTKTQRWTKKASRSSLNSGPIYVVCFSAVAVTMIRLVAAEVLYVLPRIENGLQLCTVMCDIVNILYAASMWLCYVFLWFLQRKIYMHPCVKPMIQPWMNLLSKIYIVPHALIATGLIIRSVFTNSFTGSEYGCVLKTSPNQESGAMGTNVIISSVTVLSQCVIFMFSVFPLFRVNFRAVNDSDDAMSTHQLHAEKVKILVKLGCSCFSNDCELVRTPIETATRRATTSGGVMLLFSIFALISPFLLFPTYAPVALRQTLYDISSLVNLFCIVSTLGRNTSIFFSLLPSCDICRVEKKRSHGYNVPLSDILSEAEA